MQARILIADDHEVLRRGVRLLLEAEPGWHVCGEAVDGAEAIEKARQLCPDLVILDLSMPVSNGLDAARQIAKERPETPILIFTQYESAEILEQVLRAGARGYVPKSQAASQLTAAVEALLTGGSFVPPNFLRNKEVHGVPVPVSRSGQVQNQPG